MFQFFPHLCPPPLPPVHHSPSPPELGPSTKITILNALHFYRVNCPTTAKHCLKMFYVVISINSIWRRNKVPLIQTKVLPFCILYIRSQFYHIALKRFTREPLWYKNCIIQKSIPLRRFNLWSLNFIISAEGDESTGMWYL